MPVLVTVQKANVYYRPANGTFSKNHDFFTVVAASPAGLGAAPVTAFTLSNKHHQVGAAPTWVELQEEAFVRFKNGGKRLPTGHKKPTTGKGVVDATMVHHVRTRTSRENDVVKEGDVGPYKAGAGHLYRNRLAPGTSTRPAGWAPGAAGTPAYYETDPAPHVQQQQNRDHMNNQKSLEERGLDPKRGIAVTIPQWIHMNGYTWGDKATRSKKSTGLTRSEWIALNPEPALFKEMYQELRLYADSGQLSYEIVGSYRYLYKLSVESTHYTPSSSLDNLIMHYLNFAH